jgi:peptidoglycan-associated lipoprotein
MNLRQLFSILILLVATYSNAQQKYINEANSFFAAQKYCEGAEKCKIAYQKLSVKGNKAMKAKGDMAFKTAECYRMTESFGDAIEWYERAINLDYQNVKPEVYLYCAEMLRITGEFEKAIKYYDLYKELVPSDNRSDIGLSSCKSNKEFKADKTRHVIENQITLNTKEFDMAPVFGDKKQSKMYFGSSRPGVIGKGVDARTCESFMDIWVADLDKKGNWVEPKLAVGVNTEDNEGTVCFDGRGKTMFFTRCPNMKKQNLGCDIWMASLKGKDEWTDPEKLVLKNSDSITVGHPCVSDDGKFLIFVSDMPGGFGGRDLWYTTYDKKSNTWATPINMGAEINTPGNELFPTFGIDGKLYFASDGIVGLGGLDIFYATKVGAEYKWENPKNMGYPINSESNDYALIEMTDKKGYFTSERKSPNGDQSKPDIYGYELPPNLFELKVIVSNAGNKSEKLKDVVVAVQGSDGSKWEGRTLKDGSIFWDKKPTDERYIKEEVSYELLISKEGYHEDKKGAKFTTVGLTYDQMIVIDMALLPKTPIRLPEVRYALGSYELLVDSTINSKDSLNFVFNLLEEYPGMILELSSHTDARGTDKANQLLSEMRAKECVKYLVEEKGVDSTRLVPVGKGEREPATWIDPETEESVKLVESLINQYKKDNKVQFEYLHQLNRRTEGRVLTLDYVVPVIETPVIEGEVKEGDTEDDSKTKPKQEE